MVGLGFADLGVVVGLGSRRGGGSWVCRSQRGGSWVFYLGFADLGVVGHGGLGVVALGLRSWVCRSRRGLAMVAWVL